MKIGLKLRITKKKLGGGWVLCTSNLIYIIYCFYKQS